MISFPALLVLHPVCGFPQNKPCDVSHRVKCGLGGWSAWEEVLVLREGAPGNTAPQHAKPELHTGCTFRSSRGPPRPPAWATSWGSGRLNSAVTISFRPGSDRMGSVRRRSVFTKARTASSFFSSPLKEWILNCVLWTRKCQGELSKEKL